MNNGVQQPYPPTPGSPNVNPYYGVKTSQNFANRMHPKGVNPKVSQFQPQGSPQIGYQRQIQARKLPPPPPKKQVPHTPNAVGQSVYPQQNRIAPTPGGQLPQPSIKTSRPPQIKEGVDPRDARNVALSMINTRVSQMLVHLFSVLKSENIATSRTLMDPNTSEVVLGRLVGEIRNESGNLDLAYLGIREGYVEFIQTQYQQKLRTYSQIPNFTQSILLYQKLSNALCDNQYKEGMVGEMIALFSMLEKKNPSECTLIKYAALLQVIYTYEVESQQRQSEFNKTMRTLINCTKYVFTA